MTFKYIVYVFMLSVILIFTLALSKAQVNIDVQTTPLARQRECLNRFISHQIDHITSVPNQPVGYYDSNGSGLAINDLNNDGKLDIVLANLAGDNAIFWNRGDLNFDKEILPSKNPSRAVSIIDVNSDGWLDIVFTQQTAPPLLWENQGGQTFETAIMRGVTYIGYAMNWSDLDYDGDLDFVTGSYDAEVNKLLGQSAQINGVIYYENMGDRFVPTRLSDKASSLALLFHDVNLDGADDIIVGNDFSIEDQYFALIDESWVELDSLSVMPHSTMGYDVADINNDGVDELFAVDMKPYSDDEEMFKQWRQVLAMMERVPVADDDPQIMENVLYILDDDRRFNNSATDYTIDATGWSWSAKFGDLDNDGYEDLYVVNGMISIELFPNLPNDELVEENQVYQNIQGRLFEPRSDWKLNSTASGRGMSMADLDNDGDLDIVVNNLMSNAVLYENSLCTGDSIVVDLVWNSSPNTLAVGSKVALHSSSGTFYRTITASSGYLSGDTSRLHFGFPKNTDIHNLEIHWTDGEITRLGSLQSNSMVKITRE